MSAPGPIDCDVHPVLPGIAALMPYLDDMWREQVLRRGIDELHSISYPTNAPITTRADWKDADGRSATTPELLAAQAMAPFGTGTAILHCLYGVQLPFSEDMGAVFARALNDWIVAVWLDRDPRLRASIVVAVQSPALAVAEIERLAHDKRFVSVLLLVMGETPLGRRQHWPIYAAAERHGLSLAIHAGSNYRNPPSPLGWTSYYTEEYVNQANAFQTQLSSLICEGVFAKFPTLKVVLLESGFTWLPAYLWRLEKFWKGVRMEIPWVDRPPGEIVRERVRLSLQPLDAPPDSADMMRLMDHLKSDDLLVFSTDYPHWQFDGQAVMPEGFSSELVRKITVDNPLNAFPRLRELVQ